LSQSPAYDALVAHHRRIHDLEHLRSIATWDRMTHMPAAGATARAAAQAALAVLIKQLQAEPALTQQFETAVHEPLLGDAALNFARMRQAHRIERAIPAALAERSELASGAAMQAWGVARQNNDWDAFAQAWAPLVAVTRESAVRLGDALGLRPMDALLERWEPGLRMARVSPLFAQVQGWLPPLVRQALAAQSHAVPPIEPIGPFPAQAQQRLCEQVMAMLGFDFNAGRLDTTQHPFTGGVPEDVRLATRFDEADFMPALIGTIHETGHARYQQNLPRDWLGQPLAGPHSAALHEGQALIFERQLAPEPAFCQVLAPLLRQAFGDQPAFEPDNLARLLRRVRPGRIRVAADELTYPLHVIVRVEIEQALVEGGIEVNDVPAWWNERVQRLLDVDPKAPFSQGPLQDPHWVHGMFGYFPAYLLGAMVAAQCFAALRRDMPDLDAQLAVGNCKSIGDWLAPRIWQQGARHDLDAMLLYATGEQLSDNALREQLEQRHGRIH
jgi:carboxypeptidase Taq